MFSHKFIVENKQPRVFDSCIIFGSDIGLTVLAKSRSWYSDGTFKIAPPQFQQVYIIQAKYKGKMIPCIFGLLTGKTEEVYKAMIHEIKTVCLVIGVEAKPELVLTDFEQAIIKAFTFHFPSKKMLQDVMLISFYTTN